MFCHKCGSQLPEDAIFCNKCGIEVKRAETIQQTASELHSTYQQIPVEHTPSVKLSPVAPIATNDFKEFVDSHVRSNTKFQSADDLLSNGKPLQFAWICFGIGSIVGLVAIFPIGLLIGALFGYVVAFVIGLTRRIKMFSQINPIAVDIDLIDLNQLVHFLNLHLKYLSPNFYNWECYGDDTVTCKFNRKAEVFITFSITSKGRNAYTISARKSSVWIIATGSSISHTNAGFSEYRCGYLATPILSAAVEYYIQSIGSQETNNTIQE